MSPRRRSKSKNGWPANLYERKGYFSWRNPVTREEHGLGRNKSAAFAQAVEANVHMAGLQRSNTYQQNQLRSPVYRRAARSWRGHYHVHRAVGRGPLKSAWYATDRVLRGSPS